MARTVLVIGDEDELPRSLLNGCETVVVPPAAADVFAALDAESVDLALVCAADDVNDAIDQAIVALRMHQPMLPLLAVGAGDLAASTLALGADGAVDSDGDELALELAAAVGARLRAELRTSRFLGRRVVLMAGEGDERQALWEALDAEGCEVSVRGSWTATLRALRERCPSALVIAAGEETDAAALAAASRRFNASIRIVAIESVMSPQVLARLDQAGVATPLLAPAVPEVVVKALMWSPRRQFTFDAVPPRVLAIGTMEDPRIQALGAHATAVRADRAAATLRFGRFELIVVIDSEAAVLEAIGRCPGAAIVAVGCWAEGAGPAPAGVLCLAADASPDDVEVAAQRALAAAERWRAAAQASLGARQEARQAVEYLEGVLRKTELELERLATIDPLTDTLNRRGLSEALAREVEVARRTGGSVCACLVDCDDFSAVNETFGQAAGDLVLRRLTERLRGALRMSDAIGRVGDDEFLLLMPHTRLAEARLVAERARVAITSAPLIDGEPPVGVGVTMGVAVVPWDSCSLDEVLPLTRLAVPMHARGDGEADPQVPRSQRGVGDSLRAVVQRLAQGDALRAVGQPIVRLDDEQVVGYELLSRGQEGMFEAPQAFLQLARDQGVLTKVDLRCLRTCLAAARHVEEGMHVHVNLFPTTLIDIPLAELVSLFDGVGVQLCLELSEEQFVGDPRQLIDRIAALRAIGVRLAVDDVGKGRGTLDSVMLLEPDVVKIDKDLIRDAHADVRKERLLRRLVLLSQTLSCQVVAEGVEDHGELDLLRELGVPYAQGFLWSMPSALA